MSYHQPAAATPPAADDAVRSGTHAAPLLDVRGLVKHFPIRTGFFQRITGWVKAVDGVDFAISAGETLGLVGESGCGKTTTGRCIMRAVRPTGGQVLFRHGRGRTVDVASAPADQLRLVRRDMQMIFQDPYSSLNPRMTVLNLVGEPLLENGIAKGKQLEERVRELLDLVGLNMRYLRRYPHAFSGGQRQRIGIARSLALNPRLIVADEPVSALDVSIQAQIINLLQDLQERLDLTYLFVSHDLTVVEHISDRVAVMYVGNIVELTDTQRLFRTPRHPYTEALLSAVPKQNPRDLHEHTPLSGEVADPANAPSGCKFHPRCRYAQDVCRSEVPPLEEVEGGHLVACHFARELELQGFRR